jgi:superfamily I DNA/RNA helicase
VLVGKQVDLYTEALQAELRARKVPFRVENELQDLASEPIGVLILDFLTVVTGDREPDAYTRLMDVATGWRADDESRERPYVNLRRTLDESRKQYRQDEHGSLLALATRFLDFVGEEVLASLAPQYQQGQRLAEVIEEVFARLGQLYGKTQDIGQALREFAGRDAAKLMTIHKAKGLEFDIVIVLAVEHEMFWGKPEDERSAYFVAISRARRLLGLTVCDERPPPSKMSQNWKVARRPHQEFLGYALSTQ